MFQNNGLRRSLFGEMTEKNESKPKIPDQVLELKEDILEIEGTHDNSEKKIESHENLDLEDKSKPKKNVDIKVNDNFWHETSTISNIDEFTWNNFSKDFMKKGEFNWNDKNDEDSVENLKKKLNSAKEEMFNVKTSNNPDFEE